MLQRLSSLPKRVQSTFQKTRVFFFFLEAYSTVIWKMVLWSTCQFWYAVVFALWWLKAVTVCSVTVILIGTWCPVCKCADPHCQTLAHTSFIPESWVSLLVRFHSQERLLGLHLCPYALASLSSVHNVTVGLACFSSSSCRWFSFSSWMAKEFLCSVTWLSPHLVLLGSSQDPQSPR